MKFSSKESGFGTLAALLCVALVVVIGVVGYMVYKDHRPNTTNTLKSSVTTPISPYAGWHTYTASLEPVSFQYPGDWTVGTGTSAPVKTASTESIYLFAPTRAIDGINYQFSLEFVIGASNPDGPIGLPVYSSTKLNDPSFSKTLYALILQNNGDSTDPNFGKAGFIEISATNYLPGSNTDDGNDTIPTSTPGREIDLGGSYAQVSDNTLTYFTPSQFATLKEVQQAEQIFSSLKQY